MAGAASAAVAAPSSRPTSTPWLGHRAARSPVFWRAAAHLALDPVVGVLGLGVAMIAVVLVPWRPAPRRWIEAGASWERGRVARLLGTVVPESDGDAPLGRRVAYLILLPLLAIVALLALGLAFSVPLTLALLPFYLPTMPVGTVLLGPLTIDSEPQALVATASALVFAMLVAPSLLRAAAALDRGAATLLLGPRTVEDPALSRRVEELVVSRARVVDSIEAERRRIERDLHDGAQQRLVALALMLGRAQARLDPETPERRVDETDPVLARLLSQAHDEADAAIAELRDLTRGLAPPVLDERGLDAALSALAARVPLPVEVEVDPRIGRLPSAVEAVLYFVAAEALTNVAKHAAASTATVRLDRDPTAVRLSVTDDGGGGARAADTAGGLVGLADRLSGVDGTLRLQSPAGGPTVLTAEVPCA